MEPEGSLPFSQGPATGPYPKTGASSPQPLILFPRIHSNITSDIRAVSYLQGFQWKFCMQFSSLQYVLHVTPISSSLTWSP
jgi:hypothetical protein